MLWSILAVCFIGTAFAQAPGFGSCPTVNTISPFDPTKYVGVWYENRKSFPIIFEFTGKCITANYSINSDGTIKVVNRQISLLTGMESNIVGTASTDPEECGNSTSCARLVVEFPIPVVGNVQGSYWVLDTDYTSYSVVWSCIDLFFTHIHFLWVLTRDAIPSSSVLDKANEVIKKNGLESVFTLSTNQENCP